MNKLGDMVKTADWKREKHVPVIDAPDAVKAGEFFNLSVVVGKEIAHPNTTEHHIAWIAVHFIPDGANVSYEIGRFEFSAHGQSAAGPNLGPIHTDGSVVTRVKISVPGTICATAYCNIHGLWESDRAVSIQ